MASVKREEYKLIWPLTQQEFINLLDDVVFVDETQVGPAGVTLTKGLVAGNNTVSHDLGEYARFVSILRNAGNEVEYIWQRNEEDPDNKIDILNVPAAANVEITVYGKADGNVLLSEEIMLSAGVNYTLIHGKGKPARAVVFLVAGKSSADYSWKRDDADPENKIVILNPPKDKTVEVNIIF